MFQCILRQSMLHNPMHPTLIRAFRFLPVWMEKREIRFSVSEYKMEFMIKYAFSNNVCPSACFSYA